MIAVQQRDVLDEARVRRRLTNGGRVCHQRAEADRTLARRDVRAEEFDARFGPALQAGRKCSRDIRDCAQRQPIHRFGEAAIVQKLHAHEVVAVGGDGLLDQRIKSNRVFGRRERPAAGIE